MPIGLDRQQTCSGSLDIDKEKPAESRPAFRFYFLTRRELNRVREWIAAAEKLADDPKASYEETHAILDQVFALGLAGWEHMFLKDGTAAVFGTHTVDDVCSGMERWELARMVRDLPRLAERDLPLSRSALPVSTESSVPAAPAPVDASTNPAN